MANGAGGLERAFEELIRRVVREELASGGRGTASRPSAAPAEAKPSSGAGFSTLNQAVNSILQPTSQAEIMAAALRGALTLAGRCALFVRRGENFSAWRSEGYSAQTASAMRSVTVPASQPGIFKEICDSRKPLCAQRTNGVLPKALEEALGSAVGPHFCLLPIVVQGKVVAAIYSDAGGLAGSAEMEGLELLARVTGLSLETAASRAAAEAVPSATAEAAPAGGMPVEQAPAEPPPPAAPEPPAPMRGSFAGEMPVAAETVPAVPPPPDIDSLPDAERDSHKKAHRFARVAVQDLLSYHKDKIEQGRANKNLFAILKEDIEKTRENYQKRFGQTPARTYDYLHYEMVLKLAGNDPSVLGEQYPGPWPSE